MFLNSLCKLKFILIFPLKVTCEHLRPHFILMTLLWRNQLFWSNFGPMVPWFDANMAKRSAASNQYRRFFRQRQNHICQRAFTKVALPVDWNGSTFLAAQLDDAFGPRIFQAGWKCYPLRTLDSRRELWANSGFKVEKCDGHHLAELFPFKDSFPALSPSPSSFMDWGRALAGHQ